MKSVPMALVVSVTLSLMCNLMCGQQPGGVFCPSDADCPASMVCRLDLNECVELSTAKALVCEVEESDCNPYVRDVPNAVTRMRQNGEIMGFHQSNYPDFDCGVSCPHHWQGLQRLTHADGRYFAISSNGEQSTDGAKIGIIHFPSREEEQTGRLRSNRLAYGLNSWEVAPHENDKIINWQTLSTTLEHSGGMQVLGKYLFVALENAKNQEPASIAVVDVENPDIPTLLRFIELESNEAAAVAVIKLADGSFTSKFQKLSI